MKRASFLLSFALGACQAASPPEPASEAASPVLGGGLTIGGLTFDTSGFLTSHIISGSGAQLVSAPYRPFTVTYGGRAPVDSLIVVAETFDNAVVRLGSSSWPGLSIDVELRAEASDALSFTVVGAVEPDLDWLIQKPDLGLDTRFIPPLAFECQLGYVGWTPGSHTCSGDQGTLGAFCRTGNCENRNVHKSPTSSQDPLVLGSQLGAHLLPTPIKPLAGASFILFSSGHPVKSLEFLADFRAFKSSFGTNVESGSSLFLYSPPAVAGCSNTHFCPASAHAAAVLARDLGFEELQLANNTWLNYVGSPPHTDQGLFAPIAELPDVLHAISGEGLCPMLHNLPSLLAPENALCGGDPNCPAALRDATGAFVMQDVFYFSDLNQRKVQDQIIESVASGLENSGACGMYADGMDWFHAHPYSSTEWIEEFHNRVPNMRLLPNYTLGNAALFTQETEIQDIWQVFSHVSVRDYAMQHAYITLQGMMDNIGIRARLGWVPPPRPFDREADYQMMLNAAVATGAFVTIEAAGDDPTLSGVASAWFRPNLQQTLAAVDEIRTGYAHGFFAGGTARYELHHFDSGVSTVALFDAIVPAAPNTQLEARGFGVETRGGAECGNFAECFYFSGAPRQPGTDHTAPPFDRRGSYLYHPGIAGTSSKDFTITAWFKPEAGRLAQGGIFEKGMLGYGMNYFRGDFTGHFSGAGPGEVWGLRQPITDENNPAWHHAAFTYDFDEQTFRLYVDGQLRQTVPSSLNGNFYDSTPIYVGTTGTPYDGANFAGWINDVRMYQRTVSELEIADIFAGGSGGQPAMLAWSAGRTVTPVIVEVDLASQRTAYLVPMLEGNQLPAETVRLTFKNVAAPQRAQVNAAIPVNVIRNRLARTVVVEVNSANIGFKPVRIGLVE